MSYISPNAKMHASVNPTDGGQANVQRDSVHSMPLADHEPGKAASNFKLGNFAVDDRRPMKVVVIGAGFSGITAGIRCVTLCFHRRAILNFATSIDSQREFKTLS